MNDDGDDEKYERACHVVSSCFLVAADDCYVRVCMSVCACVYTRIYRRKICIQIYVRINISDGRLKQNVPSYELRALIIKF